MAVTRVLAMITSSRARRVEAQVLPHTGPERGKGVVVPAAPLHVDLVGGGHALHHPVPQVAQPAEGVLRGLHHVTGRAASRLKSSRIRARSAARASSYRPRPST